jgi:hypothetical protein
MKAIFRETYWMRCWLLLQHEDVTKENSCILEIIATEVFARYGWKYNNRLCPS